MTISDSYLECAIDIALKLTEEFDFDCREFLSSELVGDRDGDPVFRIIIRVWSSPEKIDLKIKASDANPDRELLRQFLSEGHKIAVDATQYQIIKHEWLGVQFS